MVPEETMPYSLQPGCSAFVKYKHTEISESVQFLPKDLLGSPLLLRNPTGWFHETATPALESLTSPFYYDIGVC